MSKEKLLINDIKSNNSEVKSNNEEKQIDKLTNELVFTSNYGTYNAVANYLINKGWHKQSEGEWIEQVKVSKEGKPLLRHYKCNLCGVYLATQANFCPNCGAKMKGGAE